MSVPEAPCSHPKQGGTRNDEMKTRNSQPVRNKWKHTITSSGTSQSQFGSKSVMHAKPHFTHYVKHYDASKKTSKIGKAFATVSELSRYHAATTTTIGK